MQRGPAQPLNDNHTPAESVSSRYIITLVAQVFRLLLSLATAVIVPRALGPAVYGNYTFLLSTSAAIRGVLDSGTQQAFFTFSAQERTSGPLTRLYALVLGAQIAVVAAIIGIAAAAGKTEWLWHGQHLDQIVLVTAVDWLLFLAISFQQLGDSKGLTAYLQLSGARLRRWRSLSWWCCGLPEYSTSIPSFASILLPPGSPARCKRTGCW